MCSEVRNIEKPIIGYAGIVSTRFIDIEALIYIAKKRLDWNFVLVGPKDISILNSELQDLKNIYFIETADLSEISEIINSFDICLEPLNKPEVSKEFYFQKVKEYLSLGKPLVAFKNELLNTFKDHIYLADGNDDCIDLINKAIKEDSFENKISRIDFANHNTVGNLTVKINSNISSSFT